MNTQRARRRASEFLAVSDQFRLGQLVTEASHPVTSKLSDVARHDVARALGLLFEVDRDVIDRYRKWAASQDASTTADAVLESLLAGGRVFFTGCGSTGRLSILLTSIWRDFWQCQRARGRTWADDWEDRAHSVMAGGDFALIKSVEGFEDYSQFGELQIEDAGVSSGDVVFAITEGGETSFVIGTAWKGLEKGARVYFVYNNPDSVLREHVERSRRVIDDPRIEKLNLTTGPMAITGSTRMQATTVQLCVLLTVMEMVVRELMNRLGPGGPASCDVPRVFGDALEEMHAALASPEARERLARLVSLEEGVYRTGHKNNYFADALAIDVLTDTTERSPTFCTPPFRRWDDADADESWSFLFVPCEHTSDAWKRLLRRNPSAVEWTREQVARLVGDDQADRQYEAVRRISLDDIFKFRIGLDGLQHRKLNAGDGAVAVLVVSEIESLTSPDGFYRTQLEAARSAGAQTGVICLGNQEPARQVVEFAATWDRACRLVTVAVPDTDLLLDGVTRVGAKMLLNALSTCTMVLLGRVMGNYMVYVVPSNLKLIDRATRYVQQLAGLHYQDACYLLFEVIEYVSSRMAADQRYPPVVALAVARARHALSNEEAEKRLEREDIRRQ